MTTRDSRPRRRRSGSTRTRPRGFTLLELLTVLIIILVLVGILIPTVKKVRERAQETSVRAQISSLDAAIKRYQQDFSAYPGPLPRDVLYSPSGTVTATGLVDTAGQPILNISGAENLVLGLLGGLKPRVPATTPPTWEFDKSLIGRGPRNMNLSNPKSYPAYLDGVSLSEGSYQDGAGKAVDSPIPEILDRYNNPMPILYLRAQIGARGVVSVEGKDSAGNNVLTPAAPTQYDIREIVGYTASNNGQSIGEGKTIKRDEYVNVTLSGSGELPHGLKNVDPNKTMDKSAGTNYQYPYDAFPYFMNRSIPPTNTTTPALMNSSGTARQQNGYILISAGSDRVYGTSDDITNFGNVTE